MLWTRHKPLEIQRRTGRPMHKLIHHVLPQQSSITHFQCTFTPSDPPNVQYRVSNSRILSQHDLHRAPTITMSTAIHRWLPTLK